jgi:hypothetical protein
MRLNDQLRSYATIRPDRWKRNKWVRLFGRLVYGPAPPADPSPPPRMHGQHGIRMDLHRGSRWLSATWPPAPLADRRPKCDAPPGANTPCAIRIGRRNRPVRVLVQVSKARRAKREVDAGQERQCGFPPRVRYGKVAEYQARGAVHFHAVIRLDAAPPRGDPEQVAPPPAGFCAELLAEAVRLAVASVAVSYPEVDEHTSGRLTRWGDQLDVRNVTRDGTELSAEAVEELPTSRRFVPCRQLLSDGTVPDRGRRSALPADQGMVTRRVICPLLSQ